LPGKHLKFRIQRTRLALDAGLRQLYLDTDGTENGTDHTPKRCPTFDNG
jgi:hypothetical protein